MLKRKTAPTQARKPKRAKKAIKFAGKTGSKPPRKDRIETASLGAVVRARIDARIKDEATAVLAAVGMTPSDAFSMLMVRVVSEKSLPFEPLIPNNETIEAMRAARRGELKSVRSTRELLASLNADD